MLKCVLCGSPGCEHHIFPGRGRRQVCEEYHLIVGLCDDHHKRVHNCKNRITIKVIQMTFCREELGLDYDLTLQAVNDKHTRGYLTDNQERLKILREKNKEK